MSSVRTAKRAVESLIGSRIEFRLHSDRETDAPVEVHLVTDDLDLPTYLGAGDTHHEALGDVCEGRRRELRPLSRHARRQLEAFS